MPIILFEHELKQNITIEKEIIKLYKHKGRIGKGMFDLSLVESKDNHSSLNMKDQPNRLIGPAFKFIKFKDIRLVDFSNTSFHDQNMLALAIYLRSNPNLRSLYLDNNIFTDDGMKQITEELKVNTKLAHLSIRSCQHVSDIGLNLLKDVISINNTVLFHIDLDTETFNEELAYTIMNESSLNRDIQEKLKPTKIQSHLNKPDAIWENTP